MYRVLHRPNILCFWVGGHAARRVETMTDERVMRDCMGFIRKMLGKEYEGIPEPKGIKVGGNVRRKAGENIYGFTPI